MCGQLISCVSHLSTAVLQAYMDAVTQMFKVNVARQLMSVCVCTCILGLRMPFILCTSAHGMDRQPVVSPLPLPLPLKPAHHPTSLHMHMVSQDLSSTIWLFVLQGIAWTDHQLYHTSAYHCPPSLRKLKLQQYGLSEQALGTLPGNLVSNPFSKAAVRKQYTTAKAAISSPRSKVCLFCLLVLG